MQDLAHSSLELLYNVSRELASSLELHQVLVTCIKLCLDNLSAERGSLIAINAQQEPVDIGFIVNGEEIQFNQESASEILVKGMAGSVLRSRQPALIPDTRQDDRWLLRADDRENHSGAKSAICFPLLARDQLVGVLTIVHSQPNFFTSGHMALLSSIASQAGIAIHNALLYESLQSATHRYRELFEESLTPILITDWHGKILEPNRQAAKISGRSMHELQSLSFFDLHTPNQEKLGQNFQNLHNDTPVLYSSDLYLSNGNVLPVEIHVNEVFINGKSLLQWMIQDISERKKLDTLRDDLIAMIYHDLRSPLSNVVSSLDILETLIPMDANPSIRPIFSIATHSIDRMQRLITSLLDINRMEAGQIIIKFSKIDLELLINETIESIQPTIETKQISLTQIIPPHISQASADTDMLRRIIINLLENAAKFTPSGGKITVGCAEFGQYIKVWVEDTGPGIPEEYRKYIFQKYTRLQSDRFPKGIGLGLAFCQLAIQGHGGQIWVESGENMGSRFVFTLPRFETETTPEEN